jgi:nitroreductase
MNAIETIYHRHSAGKMTEEPIHRADVEKLLGAAVQAPNHYSVRPWRFVVLMGEGRKRLGAAMADALKRRFPDCAEAALDKERSKPLRAPAIIVVAADKPQEARVLEIENICAAAAACENRLLAADELGLGAHWRTGDAARDLEVKQFLGFQEDQNIIAFIYLGHLEKWPEPVSRPGYEDRTIWME